MTTTDPYEQFGTAFKGALAAARRFKGRETHRPGTLSYAQYGLLFGLERGEAIPTRELAEAAELSPSTATQMLDNLERDGLVERTRSLEDKRVVLVSLSDRGRAVVDERRMLYEPRWREALAEFSDDDLLTAAAVLDRIRELFGALYEEPVADDVAAEQVAG
jgi:DNA-binding MarR family transcriptional regulator